MQQVTASDGCASVLSLCDRLRAEFPQLAPAIVDVIRRELPGFHIIEREEQIRGVTEQGQSLLSGLASRRPPSAEDREKARDLGRRRARVGLPVEALLGAYHVGCRELWNIMLTRAGSCGDPLRAQLVQLVGPVWTWVQQASSASAEAYGEAVRAEDAARYALTYRFLEALQAGVPDPAFASQLARALGFDPEGRFQAVCAPGDAWPDGRLAELRRRMRRYGGTLHCAAPGATMVVVSQNLDPSLLIAAMRNEDDRVLAGVGMARTGLDGAAASIVDAEQALPLATSSGDAVFFSRRWLLASLLPHAPRLAPLLAGCQVPAADHPELAQTIAGFARNGMSLAACGRDMHLDPNTVKYRLRRWQELTGWDPRTWDGLAASVVALGLFGEDAADRGGGTPSA